MSRLHPARATYPAAAVAAALLLLAACSREPAKGPSTDWPLLGNTADMQHHSELSQINRDTVGRLGLAWSTQLPTRAGLVGNPLIEGGLVFQGGPGGEILATDLRTGQLRWHFKPTIDLSKSGIMGYVTPQLNRGLALSNGLAIIAAGCQVYAVDQKTGTQRWTAPTCDLTQMYATNSAPRVGDGLVFVGNTCGEASTNRGYVDAFDVATGERRWRFYTSPDDPSKPQANAAYEMAAKTWGTGWYAKTKGCGAAWDAITFDAKLHQVYIGVASPAPMAPSSRPADAGDELFTNSVVAVDSRTGEYRWHFKQVPHDGWGFDSAVGLMIAELPFDGAPRRVVLSVPKNGFAYTLDAKSGKFLAGAAYTDVNWASGLDRDGRPLVLRDAQWWLNPGRIGVVVPGGFGAHGWHAMAWNPGTNLLYIPVAVMPNRYSPAPAGVFAGEMLDVYYGRNGEGPYRPRGEVVAWDPVKAEVKWRVTAPKPVNGGLLHTAGGLVFQGNADGRLVALDDATGKMLWSQQVGGAMPAAPSTVLVDGEQYLIVSTGSGSAMGTGSYISEYTTTPEAQTPPRLLALKLGGTAPYPPLATVTPVPKPVVARADPKLATTGGVLFEVNACVVCHGTFGRAVVGTAPNLNRKMPSDFATFRSIVKDGVRASLGMPKFDYLADDDLRALYAYIGNSAWAAYDGENPSTAAGTVTPAAARE